MKILEMIHSLEEAYNLYGDIVVDICEHNEAAKKHYWCTSVVADKDIASIAFHKCDRYKRVD